MCGRSVVCVLCVVVCVRVCFVYVCDRLLVRLGGCVYVVCVCDYMIACVCVCA